MSSTLIINKLSVVHAGSGGVSMIFPDVCLTPLPAGPVPLPYPNISFSRDAADTASTVKADGKPIMTAASNFSTSTGDEAGSNGGVVSGTTKGKAYPKLHSMDVKAEGEGVFRLLDLMLQNGGSPTNTPPGTEVQAPGMAQAGGDGRANDVKPPKVLSVEFTPTRACCGDRVDITVITENFPDDVKVKLEAIDQGTLRALPAYAFPRVSGNRGSAPWAAERGRPSPEKALRLVAVGLGGPTASADLLEVPTVAAQGSPPFVGIRRSDGYEPVQTPTGRRWVKSNKRFGWQYAYQMEVADGCVVVRRKVELTGHPASPEQLRQWKQEIEDIWDRKFELHRRGCARKEDCRCTRGDGCCVWPIRVLCEWGPGHGDYPVTLCPGANDPDPKTGKWWLANLWWEEFRNVPPSVRAHEFGHLIGMYDEYPSGACDPERKYADVPPSVMHSGRGVAEWHFAEFKAWFDQRAEAIVGPTALQRMR